MESAIRILVVDDDPDVLRGTCRVLEHAGYATLTAANGALALQQVTAEHPDLVLLDWDLPDIDGIEVCRRIKRDVALADIFVVMASAARVSGDDQLQGLEEGADGFIARPIGNRELAARVAAFVRIRQLTRNIATDAVTLQARSDELEHANALLAARTSALEEANQSFLNASVASLNLLEDALQASQKLEQSNRDLLVEADLRIQAQADVGAYVARLEKATEATLKAVAQMVELRDPYTAGHERRVGELAAAIGAEMGLSDASVRCLLLAGYVHDIGKISLPAEILSKPTRLSAMEMELIKGHPQAAFEVLKNIDFPWPLAEVVLQHHERLDGSGYPRGLQGDDILLEARVLMVADVLEAMSSHRPYRPGLGLAAALAEIETHIGRFYDQRVVMACLSLFRDKAHPMPS